MDIGDGGVVSIVTIASEPLSPYATIGLGGHKYMRNLAIILVGVLIFGLLRSSRKKIVGELPAMIFSVNELDLPNKRKKTKE
jgi:hypothetical protein